MQTSLTVEDFNDRLNAVYQLSSLEEIMEELDHIKALKHALESYKKFKELSVNFAMLHATALIRVVELGGIKKLHGKTREVAQWLYDCTISERKKYVGMCKEGLTIEKVYEREIKNPAELDHIVSTSDAVRLRLVKTLESKGIVDMSEYIRIINETVPKKRLARDLIDGTRQCLRSVGGVGVGGDSHIYVVPNQDGNQTAVKRALFTRYRSVINDLKNMVEISKIADVTMDYDDFFIFDDSQENSLEYYVLQALAESGVVNQSIKHGGGTNI